MKFKYILLAILFSFYAIADTPPPGIVKLKGATDATPIGNVTDALKVYVENPGGGTSSANQGSPNGGGANSWWVQQGQAPWTFTLPTGASTSALQTTIDSDLLSFKSANHTDLLGINSLLTSLLSPAATAANQVQIDSDLNAFKSANHTDLGTINTTETANGVHQASIDSKITTSANGIKVDGSSVTQPISGSVSVSNFPSSQNVVVTSSALPSGAATSANQATAQTSLGTIATNTGNIPSQGAATTAHSLPVNIASDQTVPVSGSVTATISGTPSVSVSNFPATQPVSAASLPLPSGAANSALQTSGNATLSTIATNTTPVTGQKTMANSKPVTIASDQSSIPVTATISGTPSVSVSNFPATQPVSAASLPLPSGAATSALQTQISGQLPTTLGAKTTANSLAVNIASDQTVPVSGSVSATISGTPSVSVSNFPATQPVSAASLPLPSGAATSANQTSEIGYLTTIAANTGAQNTDITNTGNITAVSGTVSISAQGVYTTTFSITGTWSATVVIEGQTPDSNWTQLPINIVSSILPYQQTATITTNGTYSITGGGFTNIRARASAFTSGTISVAIDGSLSQQTVIANVNTPDLTVTGASAQTAIVNNILTNPSGTASTFVGGFHSGSVQVTSTGTAGTFLFEGSNDNVNFQSIPVYSQLILTGTPITTAITASASQSIYTFPISFNYMRLRIVTTITGGSIQAFSRFSQTTWTPAVFQVAQNTAGNLSTTATISSGTVTTVSTVSSVTNVASDNLATNAAVNDLASVAKTATFTLAITPAAGAISQAFELAVTASSGTGQTMDCSIIETLDSAANYTRTVYTFERVTGVLATPLISPLLRNSGNRFEYSCVIGGTTPSFTMALWRVGSQVAAGQHYNLFDRTMVPTTASSAGSTWYTEGCSTGAFYYSQSAATTNPTIAVQFSEDNSNWATSTYTVTPSGVGTSVILIPNMNAKYTRAFTSAAGTGVTYTYSSLNCTGP